ncbi:lipoyl(octanoyl) transferase LipB [Candidatus Berkiella cookevillensis]|uniref:Octanoyltransferase n=1 Tax=Candidatus Berkiella cookevillensis TaxID=437022 RepID=A0A0Q9YMT9_9GAMM|nr:lipoyl(octanoyl) transferase LipB [Candidatus Berkiella cookevillensis]MCS5707868.1 lipoyl(octanoyl) transferase LipB [Candidatus Berkiella cookevillensis]
MDIHLQTKIFQSAQPYTTIFQQMKDFTINRLADTQDQLWLLEHLPVFTQGQAGKQEHILNPGAIEITQSDRGGQVTYHGPGQLMIYVLWDVKRLGLTVKSLVCLLESFVISLLAEYSIAAHCIPGAPGIYVENKKIASLGLRIKKGACYHGISLNVAMDLEPFSRINPCGFKNLEMTQIAAYRPDISLTQVQTDILSIIQDWHKQRQQS